MPSNDFVVSRRSRSLFVRCVTQDRLTFSSPGSPLAIQTSSSGSSKGSGASMRGLMTLNTEVLAPTPTPMINVAKTKKPTSRRTALIA